MRTTRLYPLVQLLASPVVAALLLGACSRPLGADWSALEGRDSFAPAPLRGGAAAPSVETQGALAPQQARTVDGAGVDLGALMSRALDHNPRIRAAWARRRAAGYEATLASALPDPTAMFGWYAREVETRVGPQRWSLAVQQRIPFPGKLIDRGQAAEIEGAIAALRYEATVRDVLLEVVRTCWELGYLREALAITAEVGAVLERFAAYAAGEQESGNTRLPEVFRAESQRAQLDYDRVLLEELAATEEVHLRALLDLPDGAALIVPAPGAPGTLPALAAVQGFAARANQELRMARLAGQAAAARTSVAEQSWYPDLLVGGTYISTDRIGGGLSPDDDGKDPLILQVGLSFPLWFGRNRAEQGRARWRERAALEEVAARGQDLRTEVARAWWRVANAERLVKLYRETLLPQAEAAALAAQTLFEEGQGSFAGLLETVAAWHNFRLAEARARADHGQAVAALERWMGRPLELAAAPGEESR